MDDRPAVKPASPVRDALLGFLMIPAVIAFWAGLIWAAVRWFFPGRA